MTIIDVQTRGCEEFVVLTAEVQGAVHESGIQSGLCLVFVPHTTAGVTINENADPDVKADILMALKKAVPDAQSWEHSEGNSPAHVKASLVGSSVQAIVEDGRLRLGTWQGIFLCEFDGPRRRQVYVEVIPKDLKVKS